MRKIANKFDFFKSIVMIIFIAMLFACNSDLKTYNQLISADSIPDITARDLVFIKSDSGVIRSKLVCPLMYQYDGDNPYLEFPEGLTAIFYGKNEQIETTLRADYGIRYVKERKLVVRGNVVVKNINKKEELHTQELNWDQRKKIIYSDVNVKIISANDVMYGSGLTSDEQFNEYEIINPHGKLEIEDKKDKSLTENPEKI